MTSDLDKMFDFIPGESVPHFEIGQRVLIISMLAGPALRKLYIGQVGHVVEKAVQSGVWYGRMGYFVAVPGLNTLQFDGSMLKPFVPSGHVAARWDQCAWKPPKD